MNSNIYIKYIQEDLRTIFDEIDRAKQDAKLRAEQVEQDLVRKYDFTRRLEEAAVALASGGALDTSANEMGNNPQSIALESMTPDAIPQLEVFYANISIKTFIL